ncbi:LacI family DNA-binding transcriptional regulator [Martelella alba]|uniref:Substrate-binding domain-containing protein n=1 Tax=Martelella alba TaxID=2590451 RepID=A0ABY2SHV3_9HYPH|nr:LacI family DNA-binding transcriptional regulator [Martelella alba]TKI04315.1 substrate-binding domain-containing protein [Martelella alba]
MAKSVEQIATELGLSITTVRLVLNGKADQYRISARTQEKINDYVAKHGYSLNYTARSLKLNKTDTLGLIIPRLSNSFFSNLAEKLELRCREEGYHLIISSSYSDEDREKKLVDSMLQRNIDGLFMAPSSVGAQKHAVARSKRPVVILDRDFGLEDCPLVVSDNQNGSAELTRAMLSWHSEPIVFLAGDVQQPSIRERLQGYRHVMAAHGLAVQPQWILESPHNRRMDGEQMMNDYLAGHNAPPQAFIASSLPVLEGALSQLRSIRGYIARDINIGTFDEHPMLNFLSNNIWSVRQDETVWANQAFDTLLRLLQGEKDGARRHVIPMALIWRQRSEH